MSASEQKVQAAKSTLLYGNLLVAIWIVFGTVGLLLINPLYGWVFLAFAAFSVFIIVRRLLCNSCYYCKSCTKGIAKLSILSLGANRIPGLSKSSLLGMSAFLYIVLTVIPGWLLANSLLQQFDALKVAVLAGLVAVSLFGVAARVKNGDRVVAS